MRLAFISDLLYNLNITRRPCLVGYRVWYYSKPSTKEYISSFSAYFGAGYKDRVYILYPRRFAGEEPIMQELPKYEAKRYNALYYQIFGEKK